MNHNKELTTIILAAGKSKKIKSYIPKSLIKLDSKHTVISRQIKIIRKEYPFSEIIVVVGYEADLIMKHLDSEVKFIENENYETTNMVRSIAMALRITSFNNILIIYGDLVFNPNVIRIVGNISVGVVDNNSFMGENEVGVIVHNGKITHFAYDLTTKWAQIIYLTGYELELFRKTVWNHNHYRWFSFEAINKVIEAGGNIRAVEPKGMNIVEIDTLKDIERARLIT